MPNKECFSKPGSSAAPQWRAMVGESVGESVETVPHASLASFHDLDQNFDFDQFFRSQISGVALMPRGSAFTEPTLGVGSIGRTERRNARHGMFRPLVSCSAIRRRGLTSQVRFPPIADVSSRLPRME